MTPSQCPKGYVIRVAEQALIQLCLSGLEAYSGFHQRKGPRIRLETYGQLWGHEVHMPDGRTLYAVETASVDTSASMRPDSVEPSDAALELKRDLMTSFWPQYTFLGDFHTHPYKSIQEVAEVCGHECSSMDRESIEEHADYWSSHDYRVMLILTIARMGRASHREHRWLNDSTIEFTLGNYRMWLKSYVAVVKDGGLAVADDGDMEVVLECPALMGLTDEYTPFGRGVTGPGQRHRAGLISRPGMES